MIHKSTLVAEGLVNIYYRNWGINPVVLSDPPALMDYLGKGSHTIVCDENYYIQVKELLDKQAFELYRVVLIGEWLMHDKANVVDTIGPDTPREDIIRILEPERGSSEKGILLSKRETEVLRMVATGYSNKEISSKLFVSIHTVISHRKNITEKLGIKTISGLSLYAFLNGLISYDDFPGEMDSR